MVDSPDILSGVDAATSQAVLRTAALLDRKIWEVLVDSRFDSVQPAIMRIAASVCCSRSIVLVRNECDLAPADEPDSDFVEFTSVDPPEHTYRTGWFEDIRWASRAGCSSSSLEMVNVCSFTASAFNPESSAASVSYGNGCPIGRQSR